MKNLLMGIVSLCLFASCKKENSSPAESDYPYYFSANINGANIKFEADDLLSTYGCGTSAPSSSSGFHHDIYEGTVIQNPLQPAKSSIYVHILKYFNDEPDQAQRIAMFTLGNYGYGVSNTSPSTVNGATVDYVDADGKSWSTQDGSQTGSTFTITELSDNDDFTAVKLFKATFNCKLYDGSGNSVELKNGVIKGKAIFP
jgi:hypothetical protein